MNWTRRLEASAKKAGGIYTTTSKNSSAIRRQAGRVRARNSLSRRTSRSADLRNRQLPPEPKRRSIRDEQISSAFFSTSSCPKLLASPEVNCRSTSPDRKFLKPQSPEESPVPYFRSLPLRGKKPRHWVLLAGR